MPCDVYKFHTKIPSIIITELNTLLLSLRVSPLQLRGSRGVVDTAITVGPVPTLPPQGPTVPLSPVDPTRDYVWVFSGPLLVFPSFLHSSTDPKQRVCKGSLT